MKKNKRPKQDPSASGNRIRRSPVKKKVIKKRKLKKTSTKKTSSKTKRKQKKQKSKKKSPKNSSRTNSKQIVDESDKRAPLIWPWIASVTINGEVTCSAFIISPRIVITVTKCFPTLESARYNLRLFMIWKYKAIFYSVEHQHQRFLISTKTRTRLW